MSFNPIRTLHCLILLALCIGQLYAQPFVFKHLSINEGLSQSPIFSIYQDRRGLIWIGSRDGLIRYDGYEFKTYYNNDNYGNANNHLDIYTITEDVDANLLIGTPSGLSWFNRNTETFTYIPQLRKGTVYKLLNTGRRLWMATQDGLFYSDNLLFNKDKPVFTEALPQRVNSVFIDKKHTVWLGLKSGITCMDPSGRVLPLPPVLKNNAELAKSKVVVIKQDKDGDIWFGSENYGAFCFNSRKNTCANYRHNDASKGRVLEDFIKDIYVNNDNSIWISTRNGLSVFNKTTRTFSNYQHHSDDVNSLSNNAIWNIMKDRSGSIWLTTYAGGINIYNPVNANFLNIGERVGNQPGLSHPVVTAILSNGGAGLWIGTDGGGLNYMDTRTGNFTYYRSLNRFREKAGNIVFALANDERRNLWIGTLDGLAQLKSGQQTFDYINLDPEGRKIRVDAILPDDNGIWAGTDTEGLKFIDKQGIVHNYTKPLHHISSNHINALLGDWHGNIWIGTRGGLDCYNKASGKFSAWANKASNQLFNSNDVLSIFQDSRSAIWVGTRAGLFFLDIRQRRFYAVADKNDAKNNTIKSITEDDAGNLWVSTNKGISKITILNKGRVLKPGGYTVHTYTSADGLASNQFSGNAVLKTTAGEILFGGVNGITRFVPQKIIRNSFQANVLITGFDIYGKPVDFNQKKSPLSRPVEETRAITLNYNQAYITFKFAALNYINPSNNQYAYKLEGLANDNWHYSGSQRIATYTNLNAGSYVFCVKTANSDGIWSDKVTTMQIKVLPPLWKTWWAYTLYVLISGISLYFIIRFFRIKAGLERDLYLEHMENQRQEELHQTKLNFFTNISHEIRTPLTLISGPLEKLIAQHTDNVPLTGELTHIHQNAGRLLRLINELMDFRKAESGNLKLHVHQQDVVSLAHEIYLAFEGLALKQAINYTFRASSSSINLYYDSYQLEKVLFNLLSNAFKFTHPGGEISVAVTEKGQEVEISINDNGRGIPYHSQAKLFTNFYQAHEHEAQNIGSGIGLALSKSIVEQHGGVMAVESRPEKPGEPGQTCFTVKLKRGCDHYLPEMLDTISEALQRAELPGYTVVPNNEPVITIPQTGADTASKQQVLLVEDNPEVRAFLQRSLADTYQVIEAADGAEGWEMALKHMPDMVISDVMMPVMNGLELCRKLKLDDRTSHIPVILLTARAAFVHQVDGLETGADSYITKPFNMQMLELNIRNLLAARLLMRKKYSQQITLQPQDTVIESADEKFLSKLMKIIEQHMHNPEFGVEELSSEIGMSQSVLYRKIKAITDFTVADFIKSVRLKKAAILLIKDQMTIADVAYTVGFNNRKHFSREFKKQFGKNPTEYIAGDTTA